MQNWEVVKQKINEMNKDEFIDFLYANMVSISKMLKMIDVKWNCLNECDSALNCKMCYKTVLEKEYQPSKQERWIVHRTSRRKNKEVYVGHRTNTDYDDVKCGYTMIYQKEFATRYEEKEAIKVRDELNEHRIGKRYLWVISKVEE